jgi:beta-phosphoglucomutase-like phosphatase (HAD superfamily)
VSQTATPSPVQAILFDLDGTIIDTEPIWDETDAEQTEQAADQIVDHYSEIKIP